MYGKTAIAVLIALALVATATPATADHRGDSATYVVGNGLLVVSDDIEAGLPGVSFGGAFQLTVHGERFNDWDVTVSDDVVSLSESSCGLTEIAPLTYCVSHDAEANHVSVFVGPGGTTGTIAVV